MTTRLTYVWVHIFVSAVGEILCMVKNISFHRSILLYSHSFTSWRANSLSEHHPVPWLSSNLFFCNCALQLFSSDNLFKVVSASQDHNRVIRAERVAHFVRRSESFERKPKYAFDRCFGWTKSHCFHANRCFCFHSLNLEFYIYMHDFHTLYQTYLNAPKQ